MQEFIDGQGRLKEKVLLVKGEKEARQREPGLMELAFKGALAHSLTAATHDV